jgi:8-oxo-dGTP pyrophosphatase MutT (NUDIX family)
MNKNNVCNNCGKSGHLFHQCKIPITSIGIIAFRYNEKREIEYLMIRRKETLGYIDFMRGKYSVHNKEYIMNMLKQMTVSEKEQLLTLDFDTLWAGIWGNGFMSNKYKTEEMLSRDKYNAIVSGILIKNDFFTLKSVVDDANKSGESWLEPEWGFPKGRRNNQEKDFDCAIREFCEETGYSCDRLKHLQNVAPFEETFTGSNYVSYKHKYFLTFMNRFDTLNLDNFQKSEVSKMVWTNYENCIKMMRPYNLEKIRILTNVDKCLKKYKVYQV